MGRYRSLQQIRLVLSCIVTLTGTQVLAQSETPVEQEQEQEQKHVTGTRIKRAKPLDYAEITTVTSDQIEMSGVTNIEQLLTQLPTFSLQGQKTSHPTGNGIVTVDLRNLGPGRTLVLLNGRRIVGAAGPSVDLSTIPVSAIDRVEVMHGAASAIYGADAVAGVVNVILKQDFDGFDVNVHSGISTHGDGEKLGVSTTMGTSNDKGNITVTFDWSHRSPVRQIDRDWANPPCENVYYESYGEVVSYCGSSISPGGFSTITYPGPVMYELDWFFFGSDADFSGVPSWSTPDPQHLYNLGTQGTLSGQSDRFHVATSGHYALSNSVTAYMEGLFSYQRHGSRSAAQGVNANSSSVYTDQPIIHYSNPFIPSPFWNDVIDNYGIDFRVPHMTLDKRTDDVGARVSETTSNTFRAIVGLRGDITLNYSWDIFLNYSRYEAIDVTTNSIDLERFHTSLDPEACYATSGCVLANMFGEGTMQSDVRDFIGFDATDTKQWDLINAGGQFAASPFSLPGGRFSVVIGTDVRFERALDLPDSKTQDGVTSTPNQLFQASRSTLEEFLELHAPILKGIKGVDILNVDLAGSFTHTRPFGTDFSYRAGLVYGPLPDIKFRSALSTAFKLPSMKQYLAGPHTSYVRVNDPCSNRADLPDDLQNEYIQDMCMSSGIPSSYVSTTTEIRTIQIANNNLEPETTKTVNVGIVVTPTFIPKNLPITATFDWYKTSIQNAIRHLGPQEVLTNCYTVENLGGYCDFVTRNQSGDISEIEANWWSKRSIVTSGFDFSLNLGFPLVRTVTGAMGFQGNILHSFEEYVPTDIHELTWIWQSTADQGNINLATGMPKYRLLWILNIGTPTWQIENRVRVIAPMNIVGATDAMPYQDVETVAYWDASGKVILGDFDVVVGVQNITDRDPPYFPGTGYNGNPQVYDFIGRYVFANLGYEFH